MRSLGSHQPDLANADHSPCRRPAVIRATRPERLCNRLFACQVHPVCATSSRPAPIRRHTTPQNSAQRASKSSHHARSRPAARATSCATSCNVSLYGSPYLTQIAVGSSLVKRPARSPSGGTTPPPRVMVPSRGSGRRCRASCPARWDSLAHTGTCADGPRPGPRPATNRIVPTGESYSPGLASKSPGRSCQSQTPQATPGSWSAAPHSDTRLGRRRRGPPAIARGRPGRPGGHRTTQAAGSAGAAG